MDTRRIVYYFNKTLNYAVQNSRGPLNVLFKGLEKSLGGYLSRNHPKLLEEPKVEPYIKPTRKQLEELVMLQRAAGNQKDRDVQEIAFQSFIETRMYKRRRVLLADNKGKVYAQTKYSEQKDGDLVGMDLKNWINIPECINSGKGVGRIGRHVCSFYLEQFKFPSRKGEVPNYMLTLKEAPVAVRFEVAKLFGGDALRRAIKDSYEKAENEMKDHSRGKPRKKSNS